MKRQVRTRGELCHRAGLTLVELMGVVFIAGLLMAIVIGIAGFAAGRSDQARAEAELQLLRNALEEYRIKYGTYPTEPLISEPDWRGEAPNLTNLTEAVLSFEDPWGRAYRYQPLRPDEETTGRVLSFDLYSTGPTGPGPGREYDFIR